ncbi:MAG: hypothetical protein A3D31_12800 [Candidatus Fluviicola riflensis]|nr:MAG: hypothetical protein CHH17_17240 [Candidatus Fluviicola riflensis]OGS77862.1 MAG: hypothetical protein A3D31_12800 [Candidatus Fluviicola riflensis]OGS84927.1 MAG: hypothetical protein A2724_09735 [Fluviicola sp. RIFCSPHIGHO2_01_FULL_43_53]OGS89199.1 MAG: hypothetical protein A3E30_04040 [Fluviicola sp. RIFCSPHIGHO2_12_FULL_43_24]
MKQVIDHTIRFLLFSNCWVALSVGMLVTGLTHYHGIDSSFYWGFFAFSGTFVTYNFHRLVRHKSFETAQISTDRGRWLRLHRTFIIVCSAIFAIAATILFFRFPIQFSSLWVLATAGVIVAGYALPVPFLGKSFRDISGLKGLWITIVWVLLLYFPLWQYDYEIHYADLAIIGLFTFVQIIPFDIRDLSYDSASMKTLPQLVGIRGARIIGTLLIILLIYIVLLLHPFHYLLAVVVLFALIGLWWKQTPQRLPLLEFIWDGTLIVLGLYYYAISG